ncbi:SRPBCC family protein [Actinomadura sp. LOL_016]|uniref:SRPBCC family protein n=1 Tax=unclassified Actinomadura TaxID=2626254 RepID=UPI003A7FFAF1
MELDHEFTVPVPVEQAWSVLLDVERIAPCMPGATLDTVDGDEYRGRMKVRVGAMTITYRGAVKIVAADAAAREVTLEASAKEARGSGTAAATVRATLREEDGTTRVAVRTELNVTGRPAQFGRNILAEVGTKIIGRFAKNLATEIETPAEPEPEPSAKPTPAGPSAASAAPAQPETATKAEAPEASAPAAPSAAPAQTETSAPSETSADPAEPETAEAPAQAETAAKAGARETAETAEAAAESEASAAPEPAATPETAANGEAEAAEAGAEVARPVTAVPARPTEPRAARPSAGRFDDDAIDLLEVAGPSLAKRAVPAVGGLVLLLLVIRFLTRRRRG